MSTSHMVEESIPMVINSTEGRKEWIDLAIDLGIQLANKGIYPCSTLEYGVPLAIECCKGNIEVYKKNLE